MPTTAATEVSPDNLEQYRRELTGYCYRMLGSGFEADDAVQETMLRAWRAADGFEGRSSVRSWLYRIATNICLDMLRGRQRRALPIDLGPASPPVEAMLGDWHPDDIWISPISDGKVVPEHGDPAEIAVARETHPAGVRHRAAAPAGQAAGHPDHVRGAEDARGRGGGHPGHQRARGEQRAAAGPGHAGRAARGAAPGVGRRGPVRAARQVRRRVPAVRHGPAGHAAARRRADDDAAVRLCGSGAPGTSPAGCRSRRRACAGTRSWCRPARSTGSRRWPSTSRIRPAATQPWALQVHEVSGGRISRLTFFLETERIFPAFGLPPHLS